MLKISILLGFLFSTINICSAHVSFYVGINPVPTYYQPAYYAPPPSNVVWVPAHVEYGYWVPGRYVAYNPAPVAPAPGFVWVNNGWHRHWHHRYWY